MWLQFILFPFIFYCSKPLISLEKTRCSLHTNQNVLNASDVTGGFEKKKIFVFRVFLADLHHNKWLMSVALNMSGRGLSLYKALSDAVFLHLELLCSANFYPTVEKL